MVLLLEIGFYFFIFPKVAVNKIELSKDINLSDDDLRKLLGFHIPRNYYSIDLEGLKQHAQNFALIHDIQISKEFPDRIKVRLEVRKPVLVMLQRMPLASDTHLALGMAQQYSSSSSPDKQTGKSSREELSHSLPILVDAEGVMFQVGLGGYDNVPVLSGLKFSQGSPLNSRLPSRLYPLVDALGALKEKRTALYDLISEVRVQMEIAKLETDIYLKNLPSYIKTNGKINANTIETALIAMEVLRRSNETTEFLDMRTTGIVYRPKPGQGLIPVALPKKESF